MSQFFCGYVCSFCDLYGYEDEYVQKGCGYGYNFCGCEYEQGYGYVQYVGENDYVYIVYGYVNGCECEDVWNDCDYGYGCDCDYKVCDYGCEYDCDCDYDCLQQLIYYESVYNYNCWFD